MSVARDLAGLFGVGRQHDRLLDGEDLVGADDVARGRGVFGGRVVRMRAVGAFG